MAITSDFDPGNSNDIIQRASKIAASLNNEFITLEHLLLSLLEETDITNFFNKYGIDFKSIKKQAEDFVKTNIPSNTVYTIPKITDTFEDAIKLSITDVLHRKEKVLTPIILLESIVKQEESYASYFLQSNGVNELLIEESKPDSMFNDIDKEEEIDSENKAEDFLRKFCICLNDTVQQSKINPLIGRENEVNKVELILARKNKSNAILIGEAGVGKAQPLDSKVLTPTGWKLMGDIKNGDKVTTPDGKIANVTGVFPQGKKDIFKITFKDGRTTECCKEHLWKVYYGTGKSNKTKKWDIFSLENIINKKNNGIKISIPVVNNINFDSSDMPVDPYFLGLMLGDGCLTDSKFNFVNNNKNIISWINDYVIKNDCEFKEIQKYTYKIKGYNKNNKLLKEFQKIGLKGINNGVNSKEKFIPEEFLLSSYNDRLSLIQGILDTDGYISKSGSISLTTTSEKLKNNFIGLIQSIGGIVSVKSGVGRYTKNGIKVVCSNYWIITVKHNYPQSLVRFNTFKDRLSKKSQHSLKLEISEIEYSRNTEAQCIMIDSEDHLYITDNFVVTHNTMVVEGMAKQIVEGKVNNSLKNAEIWSLDVGTLVAGTKYRGEMEERLKNIIDAVSELNSPERNMIVFIDEIHMVMGAGGTSSSPLDVGNMLKPALARGDFKVIGATTNEEYRKHFEKDKALIRRFQKVQIDEPSVKDTIEILNGLKEIYEGFHNVKYDKNSIVEAVELSNRYITNRFLPDKAIDIMDIAGAKAKLAQDNNAKATKITKTMIEDVISSMVKIPVKTIKESEQTKLKHLKTDLEKAVIGQNHAIEELTDAVIMNKMGMREKGKPQGCYLMVGPSGTGKTYAVNQLAKSLDMNVIRLDMSEYMEKHSVSKIIGSPPGYTGYGDGQSGSGMLINKVEENPYSIIFLDEIEKAHPDVFNIFLQVFEDGILTSSDGKTGNFENTIIIMTSNAGARDMAQNTIGFGNNTRVGSDDIAIEKLFSPEFRNRLDAIIKFNSLTKEDMLKIVDIELKKFTVQAKEQKIKIKFTSNAKKYLAEKGHDPKMGARPLKRLIQNEVKKPLSKKVLFEEKKEFSVDCIDGEVVIV